MLGLPLKVASGDQPDDGDRDVERGLGRLGRPAASINLRLGMLLRSPAVGGGVAGAISSCRLPRTARCYMMFAFVTAVIAVVMLSRLDRRNVILDASIDPGALGGRFYEDESGREVVYRVERLPVALGVSLVAGVRLRLARHRRRHPAGAGAQRLVRRADARGRRDERADDRRHRGRIGADLLRPRLRHPTPLAAAAVLGVLAGSRAGFWFGEPRAREVAEDADGVGPGVRVDHVFREGAVTRTTTPASAARTPCSARLLLAGVDAERRVARRSACAALAQLDAPRPATSARRRADCC